MEPEIPGPDGFLIAPADPLRQAHLRLNDYLLAEEQRSPAVALDVKVWRKMPRSQVPDQIEAVLRRLRWLDLHDGELANAHLARMRLRALLRVLYTLKAPYTEPQLRMLLDLTIPLVGRIVPYGPVERVVDYLKGNDLTPPLCSSLRQFQANLREEMSESQASMQSLRQQLHMLLWLDEWDALDPERCWSECVRRDFRAFAGDRRVKWRALLKHLRGNAPVRMPAGWVREAEPLLAAAGIEDFREQIHIWFSPFRSGEPLPLSVAGSYVIKGLIWYCAVAKDEDLKECCLWLLDVKWKQKRNTEKVMVALGQFGISKDELQSRNLIRPSPPASAERLIEKMKNAVFLSSRNHIQMDPDGELIVIQGQLHFYRLFRSTGKIERVSDNAELELDWAAVPDGVRLFLHQQCDSPQQVELRANMLLYDSIFSRFFVAK
ncbi:MAG TPA: hypothetical protein VJN43_04730 [Bryobacteraceae bacterium]|nr:hypothetical protein [Bryobacteraceae bacterium]